MKKYFDKVWKKVFLIVGLVLIGISLFLKITTPTVIKEQYLEYGPEIESDFVDSANKVTGEIEKEIDTSGEDSNLVNDIANKTGFSPELSKLLLIFGAGALVILIFSAVAESSGGSSDKKKK